MCSLSKGKLKAKTFLPFIIFPVISFVTFFIWLQTLPDISADSPVALQYVFIYGATIACNKPLVWGIVFTLCVLSVVISAFKKLTTTYIFTSITMFTIFCLPVFFAITGNARFCISFLI